jgi:RNA polymerase sigma-70 factor (ECF subfamily)
MAEIPPTRPSLLLRLRDPGDGAAWQDFVDVYVPVVYGYARKQGLQDADAADLTQDVLCAVAGAVGRLEYDPQRGSFRNWLFTVVRRKLSSWRRDRRAGPDGRCDDGGRQLLERCPAPDAPAAWDAEWEEQVFAWACEQVRRDVRPESWQAFWRTVVEGQPGKQVAADLGLTLTAVYHARSRIRARLKALVGSVPEGE